MKIKIGIVDDHGLFVDGLKALIDPSDDQFEVTADAVNGETFLAKLAGMRDLPDVALIDVSMGGMSGVEVALEMTRQFPDVRKIALSSLDQDIAIIQMLRAGCCAYLLKSAKEEELKQAIVEVRDTGYYNADLNIAYRKMEKRAPAELSTKLTDRELKFLKLACSDLTYKQIAVNMYVSERTVDGYRESLFAKLNVQSRVGMVLEGIRRQYVTI